VRKGTSEDVRRENLTAVLRALMVGGPMSRAEVGHLTGRNRSTVASLVSDLAGIGLVDEYDPIADGTVGRPSHGVALSSSVAAFAVHPEVDALTVAIVGLDAQVRRKVRHEFDRIPSMAEVVHLASTLMAAMGAVESGFRISGIGVAVPGLVRTLDGLVRNAPHLEWREEPLGRALAEATSLPVHVANDAQLGALAERDYGAGRGVSHFVYLNGGASGIGGAIVAGGELLGGAHGYAGELGHTPVSGSQAVDTVGISGTLEAEVTREELLSLLGSDHMDHESFEIALLADRSEAVAAAVARQQRQLAIALGTVVNLLNPERIVLGGFLASLLAYDPGGLHTALSARALGAALESVDIVSAQLGANLLLVGAAHRALEPLVDDPANMSGARTV
jgi:predicted NBD/HSP70 family sugar kinase